MGPKSVFEGEVVRHVTNGVEWFSLASAEDVARDEPGSCDASWLEDLEGVRVRLTVEVHPDDAADLAAP